MASGRAGRTYVRDGNGRFASSPGGGGGSAKPRRGAKQAGGTLAARVSLAKSRNKLATNQTSAQRGAVTRGAKRLAEVRKQSLRRMPTTGRANTMRGKVQRDPVAAAKLAASAKKGIKAVDAVPVPRGGAIVPARKGTPKQASQASKQGETMEFPVSWKGKSANEMVAALKKASEISRTLPAQLLADMGRTNPYQAFLATERIAASDRREARAAARLARGKGSNAPQIGGSGSTKPKGGKKASSSSKPKRSRKAKG